MFNSENNPAPAPIHYVDGYGNDRFLADEPVTILPGLCSTTYFIPKYDAYEFGPYSLVFRRSEVIEIGEGNVKVGLSRIGAQQIACSKRYDPRITIHNQDYYRVQRMILTALETQFLNGEDVFTRHLNF